MSVGCRHACYVMDVVMGCSVLLRVKICCQKQSFQGNCGRPSAISLLLISLCSYSARDLVGKVEMDISWGSTGYANREN